MNNMSRLEKLRAERAWIDAEIAAEEAKLKKPPGFEWLTTGATYYFVTGHGEVISQAAGLSWWPGDLDSKRLAEDNVYRTREAAERGDIAARVARRLRRLADEDRAENPGQLPSWQIGLATVGAHFGPLFVTLAARYAAQATLTTEELEVLV